jgi:hypothetical protein
VNPPQNDTEGVQICAISCPALHYDLRCHPSECAALLHEPPLSKDFHMVHATVTSECHRYCHFRVQQLGPQSTPNSVTANMSLLQTGLLDKKHMQVREHNTSARANICVSTCRICLGSPVAVGLGKARGGQELDHETWMLTTFDTWFLEVITRRDNPCTAASQGM